MAETAVKKYSVLIYARVPTWPLPFWRGHYSWDTEKWGEPTKISVLVWLDEWLENWHRFGDLLSISVLENGQKVVLRIEPSKAGGFS